MQEEFSDTPGASEAMSSEERNETPHHTILDTTLVGGGKSTYPRGILTVAFMGEPPFEKHVAEKESTTHLGDIIRFGIRCLRIPFDVVANALESPEYAVNGGGERLPSDA